ncbi:hypothetical protein [Streptomyces glaucescens]|uniref:hypothetical protein n=1 Tax=Streptomyces glaucescens TaxID=1907 RepID=UPI00117FA017|nr:hypothetical protein [Streptomyces glaucescens]
MAVHVTLLGSSLPADYPQAERTISYDDAEGSRYTYKTLDSGVLVILKGSGMNNSIEVMYGPSAWESVQGDTVGSRP